MKKINKGFTLIELLIVIAIIGILASVVLVSLSSARTKANVAAMKSAISSVSTGLVMCCGEATQTWGASTANTGICTEVTGSNYPTSNFIDYANTGDPTAAVCTAGASLNIQINNTGDAECDAGAATCTMSGCTFPANC